MSQDTALFPAIQKAYISVPPCDNQQLHYRFLLPSPTVTSTHLKPPIIFLHKSASSSISYTHLLRHYRTLNHPVYAPDFPGFGSSFNILPPHLSSNASTELTTKWYATLIHTFTTLLNLSKYHIFGHHSGGCIALEISILYPSEVLSLSILGPTIMSPSERNLMKTQYLEESPFNIPVQSGSHLQKTWEYLQKMGLCPISPNYQDNLNLLQRESLDHIRAWRGRQQIYGAVWEQDGEKLLRKVECGVLVLCARDDVLWGHFENARGVKMRGGGWLRDAVVEGANFSLDLDWKGVCRVLDEFLEEVERREKFE